ncbi:MAG: MFS transporter, partial [Dehalococcoidia bacterium]|nr:MFS transporter [Dehalococcoidia bacterium]
MSENATPATPASVASWRAMFSSLQEPAFRGYVGGMLFSYLPMTMQPVTMGYLAYSLTGRATDLGVVQLAWGVPMLVLTLYAGVLCDRFERKTILTISQVVIGLGTLAIAMLTALGVIQIWMIVLASLVIGVGFAFNLPARQGMLPQVLSRQNLTNGVAINNSFFNLCRVGGPALAGVLIAWPVFGIAGVYFMMAAAYLVSALGIFRLRLAPQEKPTTRQAVAQEIGAALQYIGRSPALLSLMAMGFIYVVIGMPYQNLMPVFAVSVFDVGSTGL